jgi:hypothetical protein
MPTAPTALFGAGDCVVKGTNNSSTTPVSFTRNEIANLAIGDILCVIYGSQAVANAPGTVGLTKPSIFTSVGPDIDDAAITDPRITAVYVYGIKNQADLDALGTTTAWTFNDFGTANGRRILQAFRIINGDTTLAGIVKNAFKVQTTLAAAQVTNSLVLPSDNMLLLAVSSVSHSSTTGLTLSSHTLTGGTSLVTKQPTPSDGVSSTNLATVAQAQGTAATVAAQTLTWSAIPASNPAAFLIAFPAGAAAPGYPGKVVKNDGTLKDVSWYVVKNDHTLKAPTLVKPFPPGYQTIANMLSKAPFYIAHRGGSKSYPEMSMHAYTQSGFMGYRALEVSCARSSDGVWFGLHDASLDRTSLQTGGGSGTTLVAANMTWAQIQTYQISAWETTDTSQPSRPYMKLTDLFAAYPGHVFLLDPKAAVSFGSSLLDLVQSTFSNPTQKVIAKYYGVGTSSWATTAHSRGYTTWGYFYEGDAISTYQSQWDILGLNVEAAQASWTSIKAYGKPVIGHTPATQALATQGISRGADGLMVAGTSVVAPV